MVFSQMRLRNRSVAQSACAASNCCFAGVRPGALFEGAKSVLGRKWTLSFETTASPADTGLTFCIRRRRPVAQLIDPRALAAL